MYIKMTIESVFLVFIFVLGLIFGSFFNVLIKRFNTGASIAGRSYCFSCNRNLSWYELMPIVSFVMQKGRCTGCQSRISWQYPLVEFLTGFLFVAISWKFLDFNGFEIVNILSEPLFQEKIAIIFYYIFVFSLLLIISVYDFYHKIIPDFFVYLFGLTSFIGIFVFPSVEPRLTIFLAGIILFIFFASLWAISKGRWMGFGDAKLSLGIGWFLGMSHGVTAIVISFWIGASFGLLLLGFGRFIQLYKATKSFTLKSEIPFGPFMALATFITFIFEINFASLYLLFT